MSEDQFTKLFKYMQREFAKVHEEMDDKFSIVDGRFDRIMEMLDADAAQRSIDEEERAAMSAQLDRLEEEVTSLKEKFA